MNQPTAQFRTRIRIFTREEGGPESDFFAFPQTGVRFVPVEMDGVSGLNTIGFFYAPNALIRAGEEFEAVARVFSEEVFALAIHPGVTFRIWDCRFIAAGEVLDVYSEQ